MDSFMSPDVTRRIRRWTVLCLLVQLEGSGDGQLYVSWCNWKNQEMDSFMSPDVTRRIRRWTALCLLVQLEGSGDGQIYVS